MCKVKSRRPFEESTFESQLNVSHAAVRTVSVREQSRGKQGGRVEMVSESDGSRIQPTHHGGPHGWVPVNTNSTPVLPKCEEAVSSSQAPQLNKPNTHKSHAQLPQKPKIHTRKTQWAQAGSGRAAAIDVISLLPRAAGAHDLTDCIVQSFLRGKIPHSSK